MRDEIERTRLHYLALQELLALTHQLTVPPPREGQPVLDNNGHFTHYGDELLYADFEADTLNNPQLAKKYSVSLSGIFKRKAMWRKSKEAHTPS